MGVKIINMALNVLNFYCGKTLWFFGALWEVAINARQRTGQARDLNLKPFLFYCYLEPRKGIR